ncbi:MAG: hypothetical protein IT236_01745, partial [Bacteroidia bacterium]|nr:hypothetical protein [Bacteroidia bacterium]
MGIYTHKNSNKTKSLFSAFKITEEPSEKNGYTKVEPPLQATVKQITGIYKTDNDGGMPIIKLWSEEMFTITWRSEKGWVFGFSGKVSGYLKAEHLEVLGSVRTLQEVEVVPQEFEGDLKQVATQIHEALNSTTLLFPDVDETKLKEAIPVNLSNKQKTELETIYKSLYGKNLREALYQ